MEDIVKGGAAIQPLPKPSTDIVMETITDEMRTAIGKAVGTSDMDK